MAFHPIARCDLEVEVSEVPVLLFNIEVSFVCWESLLHSSKFRISVKSVKPFGCTKQFCKLQLPITLLCKLHYASLWLLFTSHIFTA